MRSREPRAPTKPGELEEEKARRRRDSSAASVEIGFSRFIIPVGPAWPRDQCATRPKETHVDPATRLCAMCMCATGRGWRSAWTDERERERERERGKIVYTTAPEWWELCNLDSSSSAGPLPHPCQPLIMTAISRSFFC
jgi:hypothetical protein